MVLPRTYDRYLIEDTGVTGSSVLFDPADHAAAAYPKDRHRAAFSPQRQPDQPLSVWPFMRGLVVESTTSTRVAHGGGASGAAGAPAVRPHHVEVHVEES